MYESNEERLRGNSTDVVFPGRTISQNAFTQRRTDGSYYHVQNDGFDSEGKQQDSVPLATISGRVTKMDNHVAEKALLEQQQQELASRATTVASDHEEIALCGISGDYRKLCSCEEDGRNCQCRLNEKPIMNSTIQWESGNKWKHVALVVISLLLAMWIVIYVTLQQYSVV